jgi:hypothetical protein
VNFRSPTDSAEAADSRWSVSSTMTRVVGIITLENLAEYLMVAQANRAQQHQADPPRRSAVL